MLSDATLKLLAHPQALRNMVRRIAVAAGDITLQYFDEAGIPESQVSQKADGSPLTKADTEAEAYIFAELLKIAADIPVIGEEAAAAGHIPSLQGHDYFWLVDALDGTKEFKSGSPDYTVNIALIHKGEPILGVVHAPARGELYAACGPDTAIRWVADTDHEKVIHVRRPPHAGLTIVSSKNHGDAARLDSFLQNHKVAKSIRMGSSLKICAIAAGKADLYPRFGLTSEWDTAAADAILRAAGGVIEDFSGIPLAYGKSAVNYGNPEFIARSLHLALR